MFKFIHNDIHYIHIKAVVFAFIGAHFPSVNTNKLKYTKLNSQCPC